MNHIERGTDEMTPTLTRLDDQISWYDRKSRSCQSRYKALKPVQLISQEHAKWVSAQSEAPMAAQVPAGR